MTPAPPTSRASERSSTSSAALASGVAGAARPRIGGERRRHADDAPEAAARSCPARRPGPCGTSSTGAGRSIAANLVGVEVDDGGAAGPPADEVEQDVDAPERAPRRHRPPLARSPARAGRRRPAATRRRGKPAAVAASVSSRPRSRADEDQPRAVASKRARRRPPRRAAGAGDRGRRAASGVTSRGLTPSAPRAAAARIDDQDPAVVVADVLDVVGDGGSQAR